MAREDKVRRMLRSAAWLLLGQVGDEVARLKTPVHLVQQDDDRTVEVSISIRPIVEKPVPETVLEGISLPTQSLPLSELELYLPGSGQSPLEKVLVSIWRVNGNKRRTVTELMRDVRSQVQQEISEFRMRETLNRLGHHSVAVIDNKRTTRPPGYHLRGEYLAYLEWTRTLLAGLARNESGQSSEIA
jgi:hypothetical protein